MYESLTRYTYSYTSKSTDMSPSSTRSRWCPTPDQLMILKELYRRGLTNPNASQIQKITAHLSLFGKIQGKNVFYWFQNHKARDRQKVRKKIAKQLHQQHLLQPHLYHYQYQHTPSLDSHQLFSCDSAQNLFPQCTGAREERWRAADLSKDGLIRTGGHDLMMITDMGPIFPSCRNRPPETLELFPLTSPTVKDQETTAA